MDEADVGAGASGAATAGAGRWLPVATVVVAVVSAAMLLLIPWTNEDPLRWLFLALVPVSGIVGAVAALRLLLRPAPDRVRDRVLLLLNVIIAVGLLPALGALVVLVSGP